MSQVEDYVLFPTPGAFQRCPLTLSIELISEANCSPVTHQMKDYQSKLQIPRN